MSLVIGVDRQVVDPVGATIIPARNRSWRVKLVIKVRRSVRLQLLLLAHAEHFDLEHVF